MNTQRFAVIALTLLVSASCFADDSVPRPAPMQYAAPALPNVNKAPPGTPSGTPLGTVTAGSAPQQAPATTPLAATGPIPMPGDGLPREVFEQVRASQIPLSPTQVKELHLAEDNIKKAHSARPHVMPTPVSRTVTQSFAPGRSPEIIRLATDFTSTIVFTDSTGAAWPVRRVIQGNRNYVLIPELEGAVGGALKVPSNIITLAPLEDYGSTNITFLLEGAPAPITMMLVSGQPSLDMRLDVSVLARGPNAVAPSFEGGVPNTSLPAAFSSFLDGVPPAGSRSLKSDNSEVEAWVFGDRMMVRTKLALISPFVFRRARSSDGTGVFEVAQSSVVMGMSNGKVISVNVSGFPPPTIESLRKVATN